ncbi:TPA: flavodoxin family protein, partial [Streptococcus suis]
RVPYLTREELELYLVDAREQIQRIFHK